MNEKLCNSLAGRYSSVNGPELPIGRGRDYLANEMHKKHTTCKAICTLGCSDATLDQSMSATTY